MLCLLSSFDVSGLTVFEGRLFLLRIYSVSIGISSKSFLGLGGMAECLVGVWDLLMDSVLCFS